MNFSKNNLLLYAVTDRSWLNGVSLKQQVQQALSGGITCLQLREKNLSYASFLEEALTIKPLCRQYHVPLIINDNVDVAIASDADGVHLGQCDGSPKEARKRLGPHRILGVSAHTVQEALLAEESGADYLGVGAVFPTTTKGDAGKLSSETLRAICSAVKIPVVAIGGITLDNLLTLAHSGIAGVAVVSAVFAQPDIKEACIQLRNQLNKLPLL